LGFARGVSESTDTITIRVPKSLKEQLEKTSKKNQLTLNNLINQILNQRMHWDEQLNKMGWLQFEPQTVKEIVKNLNEEEICQIVEKTRAGVTKAIKFIYGDTSVKDVVNFIDSWLTSSNFAFRHTEDSESHRFLVSHELGENWSLFANKAVMSVIEDLGHTIINHDNKEDSYSITIKK